MTMVLVAKVTVVIPNFNGMKYLERCLDSLLEQTGEPAHILVVDNGSTDGSVNLLKNRYPQVFLKQLGENTGFCHAANVGILMSQTPYVLLLNNDTEVLPEFLRYMVASIDRPGNRDVFSVSAQMLDMGRPELLDDAGDRFSALGWAFARGKGQWADKYDREAEVFAACGGAAIYRRSLFEEIGLFDELHFAYLEDIDIGYRARIYGYRNLYEPKARVLHAGSASSGSRYNYFKTKFTAANNIYLIWKNMPLFQFLLNLPFLLAGFLLKLLFYTLKGFGGVYWSGFVGGCRRCRAAYAKRHKVAFRWKHFGNYCRIQLQLWANIARRIWE